MQKTNTYTLLFFSAIACVVFFFMVQFRWTGAGGNDWMYIIDGDGKGYYAYLEHIFIHGDFSAMSPDHDRIIEAGGRAAIKFFCGTALALLPFFGVAAGIAAITGVPMEAYGELFQKSVSIAALCYLMLGLWFLFRLLRQLKIKRGFAYLAVLIVLFATNLLVFAVHHPAMSHVVSFCAVAALLFYFSRFVQEGKWKYLAGSAIALGCIYLIRPSNMIVVIFLLFFFPDFKSAFRFVNTNRKKLLFLLSAFLLIASIQNILWYIQAGKFFLFPYKNEGFYFLQPEILRVLGGFRKGWLVYTPVMAIFLAGLYFVLRNSRFRFGVSLLFTALLLYITASWWCWSYFDSFGMRPMIDFYAVFTVFFAFLLQYSVKKIRYAAMLASIPLLLLNLVQSYQYSAAIIHKEYMSLQAYRYIFLKTSAPYSASIGGMRDLIPYNKNNKQLILKQGIIPDTAFLAKDPELLRCWEEEQALLFDGWTEFNHKITLTANPAILQAEKLYAEISFEKYDVEPDAASEAFFVASISYPGKANAFYASCRPDHIPGGPCCKWEHMQYTLILPKITDPGFIMQFYFWNAGFQHFMIRNFQVSIFRTV